MVLIVTKKVGVGSVTDARLNSWLSTKTEVELSGIPLSANFTYNIDGTLATKFSGGITTLFFYDAGGVLQKTEDGFYRIEFIYNMAGELIQKIVTPLVATTPTPTPTFTPSSTITPTFTPTTTVTPTFTPTSTVTPTTTATPTVTNPIPSPTPTGTVTPTVTVTPTFTPTVTPSPVFSNRTIVGDFANATADNTVVVGYEADVDHEHSIVLGSQGQSQRTGEISNNINSDAGNHFFRGEVGYVGTTTGVSITELFAAGVTNERFSLSPSSVVSFEAYVTGMDSINFDTCAYRISGLIKRDNANNTTLVNPTDKAILGEEKVAFDAEIIADDTNEALVLRVTAASVNLTNWVANIKYIETIF